ncbi:Na(+)/H(+) antiporter [Candidatus Arthromitus sp. SFB-mouse-Japan]|uniref:cation:proton antiporter n=1 Tax=unclassified Candidatus Neoarthromitus TaxID=2638829 RepID=UPI00021B820E|nr:MULTISPECIES: cation:proton antiporter [unclassified Candidatus Arthromitus]EIA21932.1 Na(+)/H(+) antiporter [Candidatus Arthromitus sp. SFB-2]EIA23327.1 Na(+)/H(+) antiporter [Candidatus Arthromitus sp. SFB-3]EIA26196.1 Na(+)/H(+) antiporter [Candidatus Arthromitus sp. SFB-4]EIA26284.1 Na(+)/H(+) antiporter [Candidatus Arthromitus sp. SFB-5]EIA27249.1 Na(+)/H(+) antiporter [Candidatus Arthromitus sp. SFB-co]EIA30030.1 Na(+)/H(+) antiporter [Candidatus Arthromitus sp. SFB-mouse-SU]
MSPNFLIELCLILLLTKFLGSITNKLRLTNVVGALIAGIILGPSVLKIVSYDTFWEYAANIGVILLMFNAGLETDIDHLKKVGLSSFLIALLGVIIPLIAGFSIGYFVMNLSYLDSLFLGIIFTPTSVSITSQTLKDLKVFSSKSGSAIMGAAIIDDILGVFILTLFGGSLGQEVKIQSVIIGLLLFFVFVFLLIKFLPPFLNNLSINKDHKHRMPLYALILCFAIAFISEEFFHVTSIIGAYLTGIVFSKYVFQHTVYKQLNYLSYFIFSPIFFASIGMQTTLSSFNKTVIIFTLILFIGAALSKFISCFITSKVLGYNFMDSSRIGAGMISRGEVALIIINIGIANQILSENLISPLIIVVILTTIVTPILLSRLYANKKEVLLN